MANQHVIGIGKRVLGNSGGPGYAASQATRKYAHLSPSTSSVANNRVASGPKGDTQGISSHNDIGRFTSGVSMHHPYKERGGAFDTTKKQFQGNPDNFSSFATPSGGGTKARAGRTMGQVQKPKPYDDIMTENRMPSDATHKSPSGPRGGTQTVMNRMKNAGVNKMGTRTVKAGKR
jgi:hypothetical protein